MQRLSVLFPLLLIFALLMGSCRNEPTGFTQVALHTIPQNALSVTEIDVPALMEKADFNELKSKAFYQKMLEELRKEQSLWAEVLSDPDHSGIDLTQKIYTASLMDEKNLGNVTTVVLLPIADEGYFANLVKQANAQQPKEVEGYQFALVNRSTGIAWNEELAVVLSSNRYASNPEKDFRQLLQNASDQTIANDKDLLKLLDRDHDINSWVSTNPLASHQQLSFYTAMIKLDQDDLRDNYIHSYLDFEKGKVVGASDFLLTPKMEDEARLFIKDNPSARFDQLLPAGNLIYATSMALNVAGINEFLGRNGTTKGFIDFALREYGLSLDELSQIFDGEMAIAAYTGQDEREADGLMIIKINQEEETEKLLSLMQNYKLLQPIEDDHYRLSYQTNLSSLNFPLGSTSRLKTSGELLIKDGYAYISSSSEMIRNIKTENFTAASKSSWGRDLLRNTSFGTYIDFNNIAAMDKSWKGQGLAEMKLAAKDGHSTLELRMDDPSANSLHSLLQLIDQLYLTNETNYRK